MLIVSNLPLGNYVGFFKYLNISFLWDLQIKTKTGWRMNVYIDRLQHAGYGILGDEIHIS